MLPARLQSWSTLLSPPRFVATDSDPACSHVMRPTDAARRNTTSGRQSKAAARENDTFKQLKQQIDSDARAHGLTDKLETSVARRGLVIRLLTDKVLYDSGSATLNPQSRPLLDRIAQLLRTEFDHPIVVEGHTDGQPISCGQFPSNWELSLARAMAVVRSLQNAGVDPTFLSAAGYGQYQPIAANDSAENRSLNRRIEIVLAPK